MESPVALRRLRASDAGAVQAAFASNVDMARQGGVVTLTDAEKYVSAPTFDAIPMIGA
ncbi:hypothetical protein [Xylanimonas cellulosilytica]|uniref:hypothetical protein n=1 Tax=Xylanimonas cellulosilytica TaxID=186189 RepID=UPI0003087C71|nr:hypothetical protein [Xylanimonas cellulosilytica]